MKLYRLIFWGFSKLGFILAPFEWLIVQGIDCTTMEYPPVFIIGSPRSGTTLLYQLLVKRYRFAFFTNFTALFPRAPVMAMWIEKTLPFGGYFSDDFTSVHGFTQGWQGPHEAGRFWYRWFPQGKHIYAAPGTISRSSLLELRQEVVGIAGLLQAPVLFKNTYNSMRVAPIIEALPEASFLICYRDPVDTAQSILKGREQFFGDKSLWWSLPPKEIDEIEGHPYWEQVVEQVYYINKQFEADRGGYGAERFHDVRYETLCADTYSTLAEIEGFLASRGVHPEVIGEVPSEFRISRGQSVREDDYKLIVDKARELWG